jgi:hypothetical protein
MTLSFNQNQTRFKMCSYELDGLAMHAVELGGEVTRVAQESCDGEID